MPPISSVLKRSWLLFKNTLRYCLPLNFFLGVFSLVPVLFIQELQNPPTPEIFQQGLQIFAPYLPLYMSGLVILNAAIFHRLGYLMQNQLLPLRKTYSFIFKRLLSLLGATILFGFAVGIGFMALFIPGLIFATYLMFYQPLILFTNASAFEALEKSYLLVKGKMGYAFVVGAVAISMIPLWSIFLQFVLEMVNVELSFELTIIIEIVLNTLLASFFHCTILVLYGIFISTVHIKITDSFVA